MDLGDPSIAAGFEAPAAVVAGLWVLDGWFGAPHDVIAHPPLSVVDIPSAAGREVRCRSGEAEVSGDIRHPLSGSAVAAAYFINAAEHFDDGWLE